MRKRQIVGSHLHSPEYFGFFVFFAFSQWFCMVIRWDLCFVCFCFAFLVVLHYSHSWGAAVHWTIDKTIVDEHFPTNS